MFLRCVKYTLIEKLTIIMTINEAIKEITSKPKYYIGIMPQSTASSILKRYKKGTIKRKTLVNFLKSFEYELKIEEQWEKKSLY